MLNSGHGSPREHGAAGPRTALTLVEVLICAAILAILLVILLAGIAAARESASRANAGNQIRQIELAIHNFASSHEGRLPSLDGHYKSANPFEGMLRAIMPALGLPNEWQSAPYSDPVNARVRFFLNPSDPSMTWADEISGLSKCLSSYAANARIYLGCPRVPGAMPDGGSNTISLACQYACVGSSRNNTLTYSIASIIARSLPPEQPNTLSVCNRRPSFADAACKDVVPVVSPSGTVASSRGLTFQTRPSVENANPAVPNSPYRGCMIVAFADGSVRTVAANISETVFWSLVTPAAGETVSLE